MLYYIRSLYYIYETTVEFLPVQFHNRNRVDMTICVSLENSMAWHLAAWEDYYVDDLYQITVHVTTLLQVHM